MAMIHQVLAAARDLMQAGQWPQVEQLCREILAADPGQADAWRLLGSTAFQQQNLAAAVQYFEQAARLPPAVAEDHYNLGLVYHEQGNLAAAITAYRLAISHKRDFAAAHNNLGNSLRKAGALDEAIASYRRALDLKPDLASALNNLGNALLDQEKFAEAIQCFRQALAMQPDAAEIHINISNALCQSGQREAALVHDRRVAELLSDNPGAHNSLGVALHELGRYDEAVASFERAIALKPDYADAHFHLSFPLLLAGDFERGWNEYEWRWKTELFAAQCSPREFSQAKWKGEPLAGRAILLHAEQGFGDTFQFIRYGQVLRSLGASVFVECPVSLKPLLASCSGIDGVFAEGEELPPFDYYLPLMSVPRVLRTSLQTIPANVPYLFAPPALVASWKEKLAGLSGLRVGINWRGRSGQGSYRQRDIPLEQLAGALQIPGVSLISLQRGEGRDDLRTPRWQSSVFDPGDDVDIAAGAFTDTAAIMTNLDLIITTDTAIPHLAGALGLPVWLALPSVPDWRWLLNRSDSPWYPTMRLFRQKASGDWAGLCSEIVTAVRGFRPPGEQQVALRHTGGCT